MLRSLIVAAIAMLLSFYARSAFAQDAHVRLVDEPAGRAVQQLQIRGHLLTLNPTDLPYSEGEMRRAMDTVDRSALSEMESFWINMLDATLPSAAAADDEAIVGVSTRFGLRASNNGRLEQTRYLDDDGGVVWPYALIQPRFAIGGFAGAMGTRFDLFYQEDPDGIDTALRALSRAEDAYVRYESKWFSFTLGRFQRHWSTYNSESTFISANPRSYDQIGFTLGGGRLRLRSLLGELDSITADGRFTGDAGDEATTVGSERRYIAAHRLDWRPDRNLTITAFQSVLYSGANANISLKYINPLLPVISSLNNKPKNDENNGLLGFSVWYRHEKLVAFLQTVLDDFDLINLDEPASFGIVGSVSFPDLFHESTLTLGGTAIASRTFNTEQKEGQYIFLLRGLATQFSDYVSVFSEADIFVFSLLRGLTITPRMDVLWQGELDIRDHPFPDQELAGGILTGTVERTIRPALRFRYEPSSLFFVAGDFGVNLTRNAGHVRGRTTTKAIGLIELGIRLSVERTIGLNL